MTKSPEKPKPPICVYCWEPIDIERDIYGYTSEYADGPEGYWHYGCYMLPGATAGKQKPPRDPKRHDES